MYMYMYIMSARNNEFNFNSFTFTLFSIECHILWTALKRTCNSTWDSTFFFASIRNVCKRQLFATPYSSAIRSMTVLQFVLLP